MGPLRLPQAKGWCTDHNRERGPRFVERLAGPYREVATKDCKQGWEPWSAELRAGQDGRTWGTFSGAHLRR